MKAFVDASPTKLCVLLEDGRKIIRDATSPHTNNEAEYLAVIVALTKFPEATEVCSDSQLVVRQLNGEYKVNKPELLYLWRRIQALLNNRKAKFIWIPREENPAGRLLG